jgi:uncharacterized protein YdiU (UPF0061 family)
MNTDNMSILGLTIDYGPFGWMDSFDPQYTPNTTDLPRRRYCYGQQPSIALWNLQRLADALAPIVDRPLELESGLKVFLETYNSGKKKMLADKLGLKQVNDVSEIQLVDEMFELFQMAETDMTIFYRTLADLDFEESMAHSLPTNLQKLASALYVESPPEYSVKMEAWLKAYMEKVQIDGLDPKQRRRQMNRVNPKFIPRNYLLYQVIQELDKGDLFLLNQLLRVLRDPYDEHPDHAQLAERRPDWARTTPGCSMLSCSS